LLSQSPFFAVFSTLAENKIYKDILEFYDVGQAHFFVGAVQVFSIRTQNYRWNPDFPPLL